MIEHFPDSRGEVDLALPHRPLDAEPARCSTSSLPSLERYDASIFHCRSTCRAVAAAASAFIWPPAIDPLDAEEHGALARGRGVHRRPVRDRRRAPAADAGLALRPVEGPARRDRRVPAGEGDASRTCSSRSSARWRTTIPRGGTTTTRPSRYAAGDPDIFILSNLNNVGSVEVNAFQVHSAAVIQKSIREGFGLTVTEALWKARPTVARPRRRDRRADRRRRDGLARRLAGGVRRRVPWRSSHDPAARAAARAARARSTCAGTS